MANVPDEKIVSPDPHIAIPALQAISYSMDSKELRNLYANLLAKSMNADTKDKVHPAFVEVIKQMNPRDASNLSVFPNSIREILPLAKYIERWSTHVAYTESAINVFISNPLYTDIEEQASSISLLETLGLISICYNTYCPKPNAYDLFNSTTLYKKLESNNSIRNQMINKLPEQEYLSIFYENPEKKESILSIEHGSAQLTPFGFHFKKICMD